MPIEIRELVVRATVGESQPVNSPGGAQPEDLSGMKEAIIREVMERVLQELQQKIER